jgi:hypothetical protein
VRRKGESEEREQTREKERERERKRERRKKERKREREHENQFRAEDGQAITVSLSSLLFFVTSDIISS